MSGVWGPRVAVWSAALLLGWLIGACSGPERGEVLGKEYEAAHMTFVTSVICTKTCHPIMIPEYIGDRWYLTLRDGDDEGDRSVGERAYLTCDRGERYPECAA